MKLIINIPWNIVSYEGKHKISYVIDENTILYNEYMMKIV